MSIQRKTLYSISAKGSPRFWCVELDADESRYRTVYGTCDLEQSTPDQPYPTGKTTFSQWRYAEAKNIGRSNEVSSNHQAVLESLRLITEKKKSGFFEYGQPVEDKFEVMLAHTYEQKRITNGMIFFQPKLDGVRCYIMLKDREARSRNHNAFPTVERLIRHRISYLPPEFDNIILDGEIYQRGKDIGDIISAIRLGFEDNHDISFFAFDAIDLANPSMLYHERLELLTQVVQAMKPLLGNFISQVETHMIEISPADRPSIEEYVNMQHDMYVPPYEGLIIRLNTPYKFGRSTGLMKFKRMMTREFEVIEFVEGEGNSAGLAASATVKVTFTEEDLETFPFLRAVQQPVYCGISVKGNVDTKREYLNNSSRYINQLATVTFQSFIDPTGMLRFGELEVFRDYE